MVEALSLPLSGGDASPTPQAPHNARAYELFLRANELARTYDGLPQARDLYQHCLELDPRFAAAWARLGRCHRVIGKFIEGSADSNERAEQAFRAPSAQPAPSLAHKFYAHLERRWAIAGGGDAPSEGGRRRQRLRSCSRGSCMLPLLRPLRAVDRGARRRGGSTRTSPPAWSRRY